MVSLLLISTSQLFGQNVRELKQATFTFLDSLNRVEKIKLQQDFGAGSRTEWTNLPVGIAMRPGLRYGDLSSGAKIALHQVMLELLSSQGYLKTHTIMHVDDFLQDMYISIGLLSEEDIAEITALQWGFGEYYIAMWGHPNDDQWSFKFEGHHLSLNVTVVKDKISITPFFIGSDPALVRITQYAGLRPLSKEEDYGLELINMLSDEQKALAVISTDIPRDIITAPGASQRLDKYQGIKGSDLNEAQQKQLEFIITEYIGNFEREKQMEYMDRIRTSGLDNVYFGWVGGMERVTNHYYVINGPDFLIEYDNVGWVYGGDHIHSIFRDKRNDFGEDLLKKHYESRSH